MYCRNCGTQCPDNAMFCSSCGASLAPQPQQNQYQQRQYRQPAGQVNFLDAIKLYFTHYADFKGRSRRSEYWYATLFVMLVNAVIMAILPEASGIWSLVTLVPGIAICVRPLHDVGRSGWHYLFACIPVVGIFIVLYWFCLDSVGDNQWGKSPKY